MIFSSSLCFPSFYYGSESSARIFLREDRILPKDPTPGGGDDYDVDAAADDDDEDENGEE